jgi:IS1 family transposase
MNILPVEKQIQAIAALTEGMSIRATERLTGAHRDTIMRLGVRVGQGCALLHDRLMYGLNIGVVEIDELWAYVGKKQARVDVGEVVEKGDQYTFLAIDGTNKAIVSYLTGKRNAVSTRAFISDLRQRVVNQPQITTDGFPHYVEAIRIMFGPQVDYARLVKNYRSVRGNEAAIRYSPGNIVSVSTEVVTGTRDRRISTSYVERTNLTVRMSQRRFTRLTNGFSKKLENHQAAVALFAAHYNLCRVHETLRTTPAMALGVSDHIWSIGELLDAAIGQKEEPKSPFRKGGPFRVIQGGRK